MYPALDVAKYVISYSSENNKAISNLKLQKLLYFLWIDFFKETHKWLFDDMIYAWQLGPVVPDVYFEFCSYAGLPINKTFETNIDHNDKNKINNIVDRYIDNSAYNLVNRTHESGKPWSIIYNNGNGSRSIIPFDLIMEIECCA